MPNTARSGRVAQLILSLATAPARAASTVGDLLEEAKRRGSLWFWFNVVGTACSLCWRDFCSAPLRMIWLGFRGWFATYLWGFALVAPFALLEFFLGPWNFLTNPLLLVPLGIAAEIFGALMAGWYAAKYSKGKELASAFSVTFAIAVFYALVGYLSAQQFRRIGRPWPRSPYPLAEDCLEVFFLFLAAVLYRFSTRARKPVGER